MKSKSIFLVLSFVILASCGEEFKTGTNLDRDLNKLKSLETDDELSSGEKTLMQSFCAKLDEKVVFYNSNYVGENETVKMLTSNTGCGESEVAGDQNASIKDVNAKLYFSSGVPFPEVVNRDSDELEDLCDKTKLETFVPRYVVAGNQAKWFEIMEGDDLDCAREALDDNTICLKVSTGVRASEEDAFKIVKIDFMKTTMSNTNYKGVIYSRNVVDSQICEANEFSIKLQKITDLPK